MKLVCAGQRAQLVPGLVVAHAHDAIALFRADLTLKLSHRKSVDHCMCICPEMKNNMTVMAILMIAEYYCEQS